MYLKLSGKKPTAFTCKTSLLHTFTKDCTFIGVSYLPGSTTGKKPAKPHTVCIKKILQNNSFIRNIFYNFFKKNSTLSGTDRETSFCFGLLGNKCASLLSLSISSYSARETLPAVSRISTGTTSCGRRCSVLLHMAFDFWDSACLLVTS